MKWVDKGNQENEKKNKQKTSEQQYKTRTKFKAQSIISHYWGYFLFKDGSIH